MSDDRPNPLGRVAATVGTAWAGVSAVVGALVTFGVLSSAQADALNAAGAGLSPALLAVGTVLGGLLPLVAGIVSAFRTAVHGRDEVTPVSSPRDNHGNVLVPKA